MGRIRDIGSRFANAYRAMAKPVSTLEADREIMRRMLPEAADLLTRDITALIPQAIDVLDGLLRDTDDVLAQDPDAYDEIFDDDQIATSLDNAFLPVGQAKFFFQSSNAESKKLIPFLTDGILERPGWTETVVDLCYAEVTGIRLARMVWKNEGNLGDPRFNVDRFVPKDKRRFRPGDTEWKNIYLIDSGAFGTGLAGVYSTSSMFKKPLERNHFIVHRWRNTEDRMGWGKGIGARLYRLAKYRKPLIHLLLQTLENMGGGIRYVESDGEKLKAYAPGDWSTLSNAIRVALDEAKSGDTVVLPPGFKANLHFPPDSVGKAIQSAIDEYFDALIERVVNGVDRKQDATRLGSATLGKEMSKTAWRRHQYRGGVIAETFSRDYVPEWVRNNPWVWAAAGVKYLTPLPVLKVFVPGGEALKERAEVVNANRGPVLKDEYYEAHGLTEPTDEDIESGLAFKPEDLAPKIPEQGLGGLPAIGRPAGDADLGIEPERSVADAAMNGAQVTGLIDTLSKVAAGTLAPKAAVILIRKAYPTISEQEAKDMVDDSVALEVPGGTVAPDAGDDILSGRSIGPTWAYLNLVEAMKKGRDNED